MTVFARPVALTLVLFGMSGTARAATPPAPDLPRYKLDLTIDAHRHTVKFRQAVCWTNTTRRPAETLVLNFYPHYRIPKGDYLLLAKTLELLRLNPDYGIDRNGRHGTLQQITQGGKPLAFHYREDNTTTIVVELPEPVAPGQSVTVEIDGTICLPNKQGRWGHWRGITYLTNALPVVAYYDDRGWHDTPFVPWHQPFWNEAGVYTATVTLPADQKLACSAEVASEADLGDGWKRVVMKPFVGRDFAVVCSALFREYTSSVKLPDGREVALRCLAYERHETYAWEILKIVAEALPVYSEWFGPFPYDQFTIAESYFGWNGNECGGLILIDERVFDMPTLAKGYVEYLVSHETCHQWWYNLVGTNGSAETVMDEGPATYFTHRLLDHKRGKNNPMLEWPPGLKWVPNIHRENYRWASWYGAVRRDDAPPAAMPLTEYGNLVALFSGAYDRGSKVFGMIEARLGPEFLPFMRGVVRKYSFKVISLEAFKAELVAFTGPQTSGQWDEFFDRWVYGKGLTDWEVERVSVEPVPMGRTTTGTATEAGPRRRVTVTVRQTAEHEEPTVVGFQLAGGDGFPIRVPVGPGSDAVRLPELDAEVEKVGPCRYAVRITLPCDPTQVTVDPDRILLDANPGDNNWRRTPRVTVAPLYSVLNETDLTNDWDRWNLAAGPWFWGPIPQDPWYTRSTMLGVRAGAYRTQTFYGGAYAAFRTEFQDAVVGVDGVIDHWPCPKTQVGFNYERRVGGPWGGLEGRDTAERAVAFARYVFRYHSSLYLPPMHYAEAFVGYQDNFLPFARQTAPGSVRPGWTQLNGLHYRLNLYTPYWDPEHGVWVDVVAAGGVADLGADVGTYQARAEVAAVRKLPECWGYLSHVRVAGRLAAMGAGPDRGDFFALGGGTQFRGFDQAERQGSFAWVASGELRFPVVRDVRWNFLDSVIGVRNVTLAGFYDAGEVYGNGRSVGGVAHAVGGGVRVDVSLFSFIERATVRLDVGKAVNAATPVQVWFGVQHPF